MTILLIISVLCFLKSNANFTLFEISNISELLGIYTKILANTLVPQLTDEVEWIIVDDGSHEYELDKLPAKVIHLENNSGSAAHPRNIGIEVAIGEFITFIDSLWYLL